MWLRDPREVARETATCSSFEIQTPRPSFLHLPLHSWAQRHTKGIERDPILSLFWDCWPSGSELRSGKPWPQQRGAGMGLSLMDCPFPRMTWSNQAPWPWRWGQSAVALELKVPIRGHLQDEQAKDNVTLSERLSGGRLAPGLFQESPRWLSFLSSGSVRSNRKTCQQRCLC